MLPGAFYWVYTFQINSVPQVILWKWNTGQHVWVEHNNAGSISIASREWLPSPASAEEEGEVSVAFSILYRSCLCQSNGTYLSSHGGKPSHVEAQHLLGGLPPLSTHQHAAWCHLQTPHHSLWMLCSSVGLRGSQCNKGQRCVCPVGSELPYLSLKQSLCLAAQGCEQGLASQGYWALPGHFFSLSLGLRSWAVWSGSWLCPSAFPRVCYENLDDTSLLLWDSSYLEMHLTKHLKIS